MKMSASGRAKLIAREGAKLRAYKDTVGIWTIGVGHTNAAGAPHVTPGLTITKEECDAIFARDLVQYENAVSRAVTVPVSQGQFDALVSLCFNIGTGAFARSTVVRKLNAGDPEGAGAAFMLWNKPPEILGRRRTERDQFLAATHSGEARVEPKPAEEADEAEDIAADEAEPDDTKPHAAPAGESKSGITEGAKVGAGLGFAGILSQAWEVVSQAPDTILQAVIGAASKPAFWVFIGVVGAAGYIWYRRHRMKKAA